MTNRDGPKIFEYFDEFAEKNLLLVKQFLDRFPIHKSYINKDVLDFGSGTGCLCFELVDKCGSITRIDVDTILHQYSKQKLKNHYEHYNNKIIFLNKSLKDLESASFDIIFSKDVFEHVQDSGALLHEMYRILKPGGECLIGFGPLWYSPFGDHGIVKSAFGFTLPWLHLVIGKKNMVRAFNYSLLHEKKFSKQYITDLSTYLNFKSGDYFRHLVEQSDFEIIWYDQNINENWFVNLFKDFLTKTKWSRFFIRNIYCILKKPTS